MKTEVIIILAILVGMSLISFIAYAVDKSRAVHGQWRIQERTLLSLAVCGGALGAIVAMYTLRHKNRKWYFVGVNTLSLIFHIVVVVVFALQL